MKASCHNTTWRMITRRLFLNQYLCKSSNSLSNGVMGLPQRTASTDGFMANIASLKNYSVVNAVTFCNGICGIDQRK